MEILFLKKHKVLFPKILSTIFLIIFLLNFSSCKFPSLVAPEGSVLIVTINPDTIAVGESAVVKVTGYRESGAPLKDKTVIYFSTTIGSITPTSEINNGYTTAILKSNDGRSGEAIIKVYSGNAEVSPDSITVKIGNAGLEYLFLSASILTLPPEGGETEIKVTAYDKDMNALKNIPIIFSLSSGNMLNGGIQYTDINGMVVDVLKTYADTTVTAKSGVVTGLINIVLEKIPSASFSYSPTLPKVGDSVDFDASLSSDQDGIIMEYKWSFGDGTKGSGVNISHIYHNSGIYNVKLTVYDNSGNTNMCSKSLNVSL